ncbi:MAG: EAL domain-containing protein [Gammaproteobacteria bacterium]|nr:EAL domain-containing protein [Gammaproteobacteria bacterium]MBU1730923.1 EAL domain-containing protein [Gammaproteobacteria bacterium]MBU1893583.1 EAL domain-containing protein [Gammaproteobacteria bacterium]
MGLHAVLMGLIVADMVTRQQSFMEHQISREGQSRAITLAASAPVWLLSNDIDALDALVNSMKSVPHLQLALILDSKGKVRATTDSSLFNLVLDDAPSKQLLATGKQIWHGGMVDSISEITSGNKRIGYARIILNGSAAQSELDAVTHRGILYAITAILLGGLLSWLLVRSMTHKLRLLSNAADSIAAGKLDVTLADDSGRDEVSRLSRDFNLMARALEQDQEQRSRFEKSLFMEKERALVTLHSIGDGVITTDTQGRIEFLNPVAEELTGWNTEEACGLPLTEVFHIINEDTRTTIENPVNKALQGNCIVGLANHTVLIRRDGREFSIEDSAAPIRDRDGVVIGVVLVFHDNTQSHAMAREISYQASHDALTGLLNRREFEHQLSGLIGNAIAEHHQHALLYLDLDQFKVINDTCGHAAGDELLRQLTLILQARVRENDMLARLGGDEFGVLLQSCPVSKALVLAEELIETVRTFHFCWGDKIFSIGASIGLVAITHESQDWASLLSHADTACYLAKERGRNRVQVYHADDAELAQRHNEMHWVGRIAKAFEEDRFLLYYQPIVPTSPGKMNFSHFEVLVRMLDEDGKLVAPGVFIPAAERYNLMLTLDRWVVNNALNWLAAHKDIPMVCAINLSGHSMGDERFLAFIISQIKGTGVAPDNLCFEVTETAAIGNLTKAVHFIRELKALGCRFALDDFGAGLSSFAYLKNLPVDYLKIDGGFVKDMDRNETNHAMVEAINNIGHTMKIQTIAEFVENQAIFEQLKVIGVDFAQGYLIAKPAPLDEFHPE